VSVTAGEKCFKVFRINRTPEQLTRELRAIERPPYTWHAAWHAFQAGTNSGLSTEIHMCVGGNAGRWRSWSGPPGRRRTDMPANNAAQPLVAQDGEPAG
jgi:hypothetical protein